MTEINSINYGMTASSINHISYRYPGLSIIKSLTAMDGRINRIAVEKRSIAPIIQLSHPTAVNRTRQLGNSLIGRNYITTSLINRIYMISIFSDQVA